MDRVALAIAFFAAGTQASAQNGGTLDAVARAMGGKEKILPVRTLVLEGKGDNYNLGQNLTPSADLPRYEVTQYRRSIDYVNLRWIASASCSITADSRWTGWWESTVAWCP